MANAPLRADEHVGTTTPALVPVFTGALNSQSVQLCDARTLHAFMQVKRDFSNWIKGRIRKFGFVEGVDFITVKNLSSPDLASSKSRARTLADYHLTLDMAKELSMVENNPQGREARRHFIACEKRVLDALVAYGYPDIDARITPAKAAPVNIHGLPAPDSIDVRALLLSGQSEPTTALPPELQKAIELRAWTLAHEAYGLVREHLERRVAFHAVSGVPRRVNVARAEQVISEGTLGTALARTWHNEISTVVRTAEMTLSASLHALEGVRAAAQGQGGAVNSLN